MDEVISNKAASIEKCLKRIEEESVKDWKNDFTVQDSLILNLERACQASIDVASHIVRKEKLGLPKFSREVYDLLLEKGIISQQMSIKLKNMVGFRNIAVHDYSNLNLAVVEQIIEKELSVFKEFVSILIGYSSKR